MTEFPELNSFGTLLKFAIALEEVLGELARRAAERGDCEPFKDELADCARKHGKRGGQLERLKRERLNEVVLQAITGMDGKDYEPATDLDAGAAKVIADGEERAARFYADAATKAAEVMPGVDKTLKKLGKGNDELARSMRAKVS